MGSLIDSLPGNRVYLDTCIFIYAMEGFPDWELQLRALFEQADAAALHVVTSELTLAEVLVKPIADGNEPLARAYEAILTSTPALTVVPVSRRILVDAARMRASQSGVRLPDAVHLATAVHARCDVLLSNDRGLKGSVIPVLLLDDIAGR